MAGMMDEIIYRLSVADHEIKLKIEAATALRDNVDHYTTGPAFPIFLGKAMPVFINILRDSCSFKSNSPEQKLRSAILETIYRFPSSPSEPFEPYAEETADLLMTLVRTDNEENANVCVKIVGDMLRHQSKVLGHKAQPFLTLIQEIFERMDVMVREQLDNAPPAAGTAGGLGATPSTPNSSQANFQSPRPTSPVVAVSESVSDPQQQNRPLLKGMQSFKVVTECPIVVLSTFQAYRQLAGPNLKQFMPLIKNMLCLQAAAQKRAHADAAARNDIHFGVSPGIKNRVAYGDFITAQVKTMSFLVFLARQYQSHWQDFVPALPEIVIRLLRDIPREKSAVRKELFIALRHIINFYHRIIFLPRLNEFLDSRTLLGDGLAVHVQMRPIAYSMVADLVHHLRDSLRPDQIKRVIEVYTENLLDGFANVSFQTMSAKMLFNITETIAKLPNPADGRYYLITILDAIGNKFAIMNRHYHWAVKNSGPNIELWQLMDGPRPASHLADKDQPPEWDDIDIFRATPIRYSLVYSNADRTSDYRYQFKCIMQALKGIFYQLKHCGTAPPIDPAIGNPHLKEVAYGFTPEEVKVVLKLFREGAYVFRYYDVEKPLAEPQYASPVEYMANLFMMTSSKEEKDLLEAFATIFHAIDPATFHEVFQQEIPHLYEMIFEHTGLLHIPQFLLASEATSPSFCGMLLSFLMEKMHEVGSSDIKKAAILLRLFKLAFMAVTLYASHNEQVLLPHVVDIITKSIELSTKAEEPMNYFLLLRSLFRSIGGGKFEHLYNKILPLLEMLLDVLNNLLMAARKQAERDLYVELCLTVPARLSNLLPHLSFLMRPLVVALRAGPELVSQGLRTLELCVDNLTADYLDPIMAPVIDELMTALFYHLKPHPYSHFHAHTTVRILGKLGGRNRKSMMEPLPITFREFADDASSFDVRLIGSKKERAFPAELGIELAIRKLMESPRNTKTPRAQQAEQHDGYYKKQAVQFIKAQVKLRIGFDSLPDDLARIIRLQAQDLLDQHLDHDFGAFEGADREKSIAKKNDDEGTLKRLLKAMLFAQSLPEHKEESATFLRSVAHHFILVELGRALVEAKLNTNPFSTKAGEGPLGIDARVINDVVVESLASDNIFVREGAQRVIRDMYEATVTILGAAEHVGRLPLWAHLGTRFCHACYEEEWFTKAGGTLGIKSLLADIELDGSWIATKQNEFLRALMYVIKDMPQDLPQRTRNSAQDTLEMLLRHVTKHATKADALPATAQPGETTKPASSRLAQACSQFNTELLHMNRHVRETAKRSLGLIAKAVGAEVWELLEPYRERFLQPIYAKPLRALPFPIQIGYIDAMTYHMTLKSDWVTFDDNLLRLLHESLALADATDDALANKPAEFRTRQNIINLRVACIKILKTALGFEDFNKSLGPNVKNKIVLMFFKCLYADATETIDAANDALRAFLSHINKMPKELLQQGLRPILASLSDSKRMNTSGLDKLARMLKLLTTYFKTEIGTRLLDHVKALADPDFLLKMSFTFFEQTGQMKVIAAIINIFHLLPRAADLFKQSLIDTVLDLEEKLRRTQLSPFRKPLLKYLNRYPAEIWTWMLERLEDRRYGRLLAQVLWDPGSDPLREVASSNVGALIAACNNAGGLGAEAKHVAIVNTIHILDSISQFPEPASRLAWLGNREMVSWLKGVGKDLKAQMKADTVPEALRLATHQASEQVTYIILRSLELGAVEVDALFAFLESVTADELVPVDEIQTLIYRRVISSDSLELWRNVVTRSLDVYASKTASQKLKQYLLYNLVNPIVAMDVMRNWNQNPPATSQLMDRRMVDTVSNRLWKVHPETIAADDMTQVGVDHVRFEVLQLSAMLVKYYHETLFEARKDIIKFGWTYIRLEDVINKHAAYIVIAYFIAHYETPGKIVSQVYMTLLKTNPSENRGLVSHALDLMVPLLPKRCTSEKGSFPWGLAPRRILLEDSQNEHQLSAIFRFLARHADLFYEYRDKYIMYVAMGLRKVAGPVTRAVPQDSCILAVDMLWMVWTWEKRRIEGQMGGSHSPASKKRKMGDDGQTPVDPSDCTIPAVLRQKMIKFLVELAANSVSRFPLPSVKPPSSASASATSSRGVQHVIRRSLFLLSQFTRLDFWATDLELDLVPSVTEQFLASDTAQAILTPDPDEEEKWDELAIGYIINVLQTVRVLLNTRPDEWIQKNMSTVLKLLEKSMRSEHPEIQDCIHLSCKGPDDYPFLDEPRTEMAALVNTVHEAKSIAHRVLEAVPEDVPMEDADGEADAEAPLSEAIAAFSSAASEMLAAGNYMAGVHLLWSLCQRKPGAVDSHIPALMKALQSKLAKDHVQHYAVIAAQQSNMPVRVPEGAAPPEAMSPWDLEVHTRLMLKTIQVLAWRIDVLGESRRPFLSVLATLIEKSQHATLCDEILEMVKGWVFRSEGTWPSLKEKTAVLHKMSSFEHRADPTMLSKFLDLVVNIYEDPKIARTELTVRMEHAFLIGTRAQDVDMRNRFMTIFDRSLSRTASTRLAYILKEQSWEMLADSYWLAQASQLLMGSVEMSSAIQLHHDDFKTLPVSRLAAIYAQEGKDKGKGREPTAMLENRFEELMASYRAFMADVGDVRARDIIEPLMQLQHTDQDLSHQIWVSMFPMFWATSAKDERHDLERGLVTLLTKEYHNRQIDKRPNVAQSLVEGVARAWPSCKLPPHVLKFQAKTYSAWYPALVQLENFAVDPIIDTPLVRESNLDALVDAYAAMQEEDLFYGTWRRRCQFMETNVALSYEQNGMWDKAQRMYENAQLRARTGALPFSQSEYMLWEDHWVLCAQKLQQWDVLQDFAKHENFQDLLLECAWRNTDMWQQDEQREALDTIIKGVIDAPTPRRAFFQAFMALLKFHYTEEPAAHGEFARVCDEAIQLSIRKWHQLPERLTNAHVPLLQNFQQLVELHDASNICQSLAATTAANLDVKSGELKLLLGGWRDRLPNVWDDITAWQDLVTWRQHIFGLINQTYLQLLPPQNQPNAAGGGGGGGGGGASSYAYRGYHETAWIINRFAHVARKHNLPEVCINQLSRIYTLPNIEIQEAFLKLREQAKCHYENHDELTSGLDVINNTNLNYFSMPQKAEFYTLKGMFLDKLNQKDDADQSFGTALFFDITAAKAWAEWGYFHDRKFKNEPTNLLEAKQAVTAFLQAAGSYKNAKARKLIARILYLLTLDDAEGTIAAGFDDYKGETPVWYWITFIPQLLTGLNHKESPRLHNILTLIAKTYPQALYFQLRTSREDLQAIRKSQEAKERMRQQQQQRQSSSIAGASAAGNDATSPVQTKDPTSRPATAYGPANGALITDQNGGGDAAVNADVVKNEANANPSPASATAPSSNAPATPIDSQVAGSVPGGRKQPWEVADEVMKSLKTAFPLLALSMETMVDQIQKHFKCPPDEDAYRLIMALLNDGLAFVSRAPSSFAKDVKLPQATEGNITRFAETILPAHIRKTFEADFVTVKPTMYEYIHKLRHWRNKFEEKLDRRPRQMALEAFSPHLSEFRYAKFDEMEIPGQYLQHKDKNQDFVRIDRFLPDVDLVRGISAAYRRLKIRGHDGSVHAWMVQHPAARNCRREERILQLFRQLNQTLGRKKESRRRGLQFTLPLMVPLAPHIRLVQEDTSYISLQGVYEDHCRRNAMSKDDPVLFTMEKLRALLDTKNMSQADHSAARLEVFTAIQDKWVPHTVALKYFQAIYPDYSGFWLFRRQFAYQLATLSFMTYLLSIHQRYPHKINISRRSGNVWSSELIAYMANGQPVLRNLEPVPFRLTPNLQTLMGPLATEGIFTCAMVALARCLTDSDYELEHSLALFVRDEVLQWFQATNRTHPNLHSVLPTWMQVNSDAIVKRAVSIGQNPTGTLPAGQTVTDQIAHAVNPLNLAACDALWMPYL